MEAAIRILDGPAEAVWDYDEEADVLYLSVGELRSAVGMDIGEGVVANGRLIEQDKAFESRWKSRRVGRAFVVYAVTREGTVVEGLIAYRDSSKEVHA